MSAVSSQIRDNYHGELYDLPPIVDQGFISKLKDSDYVVVVSHPFYFSELFHLKSVRDEALPKCEKSLHHLLDRRWENLEKRDTRQYVAEQKYRSFAKKYKEIPTIITVPFSKEHPTFYPIPAEWKMMINYIFKDTKDVCTLPTYARYGVPLDQTGYGHHPVAELKAAIAGKKAICIGGSVKHCLNHTLSELGISNGFLVEGLLDHNVGKLSQNSFSLSCPTYRWQGNAEDPAEPILRDAQCPAVPSTLAEEIDFLCEKMPGLQVFHPLNLINLIVKS